MYKRVLKGLVNLFFIIVLLSGYSYAKQIKFDNEIYELQYSKRAPLTRGYINEYIRPSENTKNWIKLICIYYYPDKSDPISLAKNMEALVKLTNSKTGTTVYVNKDKNEAMVDFIAWPMTKDQNASYMEFNVFKYKNYNKKGVIAFQYAQRYYEKGQSYEELKREFNSNRKKIILLVADTSIPKLIEKDVEKK